MGTTRSLSSTVPSSQTSSDGERCQAAVLTGKRKFAWYGERFRESSPLWEVGEVQGRFMFRALESNWIKFYTGRQPPLAQPVILSYTIFDRKSTL